MHTFSHFGDSQHFKLERAILIYQEHNGSTAVAATAHPIHVENGRHIIKAGSPVTTGGVEALASALGRNMEGEIIPERVLSIGVARLVWWTPAARRRIWFNPAGNVKHHKELKRLNGKVVSMPPLVFVASEGRIRVHAVAESARPVATTCVFLPPFYNIDPQGYMCLGTVQLPSMLVPSSYAAWEKAFFNSAYSHSNWGHQLTKFPGGHLSLWQAMVKAKTFPSSSLVPTKLTVASLTKS